MSESTAQRSRAEAEAAQWFARLSGSVTNSDLAAFRDWRRLPGNAEAYAHVETTWDKAGGLRADPDIRGATAEAFQRRPPRPASAGRHRFIAVSLGTAGLVAALFGGTLVMQSHDSYTTKTGEQRLVVLADGSRVRLNTDTALRVRFGPGERRLTLARGEAFFEAAHDASRPFVVDAGGTQVRALGTRFDVRRDADAIRVTLLQGRVQVAHADQAVTLAPNQQATVVRGRVSAPAATDAGAVSAWTTGRLHLRGMPLAEAVAEVNRYATAKISLEAPAALGDRPVSGVFDAGDTAAFVAAVSLYFDLQAVTAPDGSVRLIPRAQPSVG